jgi:hypothetical protein
MVGELRVAMIAGLPFPHVAANAIVGGDVALRADAGARHASGA